MFYRLGCLIVLAFSFCAANKAEAEMITLTTGEQITGPIIKKTDAYVIVDMDGLPHTFYLGEIQSIDGQDALMTPPPPVVVEEQPVKEQATENQPAQSQPVENQPSKIPDYGDEEQSLINFMNARATSSAAQTNTDAPAATPPVAAAPAAAATPAATEPAAPVAPAVAAPTAAAPAAPDDQTPPTLQQFLHNTMGSVIAAPAASAPAAATPATPAAPAAPAAAAPAAPDDQSPPTLQQFLQKIAAFIHHMIASIF